MDVYGIRIRIHFYLFIYLLPLSIQLFTAACLTYVSVCADLRETVRPIFIMSFTIDGSVRNNINVYTYIAIKYTCVCVICIPSVSDDYTARTNVSMYYIYIYM